MFLGVISGELLIYISKALTEQNHGEFGTDN